MAELRVTILGCGSSGGVPRLGGRWGACDPTNPKNRRRRCAILVERVTPQGATRVLVDAGPDMREQLLSAEVGDLDAVLFTHEHADHVHGIDDLRQIVFNRRARLPVWAPPAAAEVLRASAEVGDLDAVLFTHEHADHVHGIDDLRQIVFNRRARLPVWAPPAAAEVLRARFAYVFEAPPGSLYPPILDLGVIDGPVTIDGAGGPLTALPFATPHGSIEALGFRFGPVAYLPDVSAMSEAAWAAVQGLECWIVDALRYEPHMTHSHLAQTLDWIARAKPARAVITNMHIDLDHDRVAAETPDHVDPAHDGMTLTFRV